MQRYPPRPRINTCVICRNDFMLAVSAEPRSLATACQAICSSRRCPHRSFRPGAMPIARMTSELRSVAATSAWAEIDDCVARLNDRLVKYSLATAIIKVRMPVPIASQPKIGVSHHDGDPAGRVLRSLSCRGGRRQYHFDIEGNEFSGKCAT